MNVRKVLDYVVIYMDLYVYEIEIGSGLCGGVCG